MFLAISKMLQVEQATSKAKALARKELASLVSRVVTQAIAAEMDTMATGEDCPHG